MMAKRALAGMVLGWLAGVAPGFACEGVAPFPNVQAALPDLKILAIGSSSTGGVGAGKKDAAYPQQIAPALAPWSLYPTVDARGVGGEKAAGALARLPDAIAETDPVLVIWQVGTNDANARLDPEDVAETIRAGIAIIRAAGADVLLVDPQFYPRIANKPHYEEMAERIDAVGAELCVPVVDRFEEMRAAGPALPSLLARDRFHMSAQGHRLLAESIGREIRCGLGYPCEKGTAE